jgi:hypothetical protein
VCHQLHGVHAFGLGGALPSLSSAVCSSTMCWPNCFTDGRVSLLRGQPARRDLVSADLIEVSEKSRSAAVAPKAA